MRPRSPRGHRNAPSSMVASTFPTVRPDLPLLPDGTVVESAIVRAPVPPAALGLPTPNFFCISLALRVRTDLAGVTFEVSEGI